MRLAELRKATGLPAQTTLRGHLAALGELGLLAKRPTEQMPYAVENELTPMGREMLTVADRLETWLGRAPDGPIALESGAASGAVKALVDGWGSTMMRALAAGPLSLTELDSHIAELSYPALERRLSSMRIAGLVEARPSRGAGTPYGVTEWARRGIAPLAAASYCERVHMGRRSAGDPGRHRGRLPAGDAAGAAAGGGGGVCQLEVEAGPGGVRTGGRPGDGRGRQGRRLRFAPGARPRRLAAGPALAWFQAVKDGEVAELRFGGGTQLAEDWSPGSTTPSRRPEERSLVRERRFGSLLLPGPPLRRRRERASRR